MVVVLLLLILGRFGVMLQQVRCSVLVVSLLLRWGLALVLGNEHRWWRRHARRAGDHVLAVFVSLQTPVENVQMRYDGYMVIALGTPSHVNLALMVGSQWARLGWPLRKILESEGEKTHSLG